MSFDELYDAARDRFSKGDRPGCESLCRQAIEQQPEHAGALNLLGQCVLDRQPGLAAAYFSRAVQARPDLPNLRFNLALAYQREGRIPNAIEAVREALRLDPSVPALHGKLGLLLITAAQPEEAEVVLRTAIALEPKSTAFQLNLAMALTDLNRLTEAEQILQELLTQDAGEITANRLLGRIYQIQGKTLEATASFERCMSIRPEDAATIHTYLYSRKVTEKDRALLDRIRRLVGKVSVAPADQCLLLYALGKGLDDLGEYREAAEAFQRANALALQALPPFDQDQERRRNELRTAPLPSREGSLSERPVFIVGMIRSGTTLVEQILGRHSRVATGGENGFWLKHEAEILSGGADLTPWIETYTAWMDKISATAEHVTDKMPLNYQALGLIHQAFPNARIVHVQRDRRDTCLSVYVTPYRVSPPFGHSMENIRFAYEEYERLMAHWRSELPTGTMIEIDYEELVADTEATARRLETFLGLEWEDGLLDAHKASGEASTPSAWQARQPIYGSSVGRWKNYEPYLTI